MSHRLQMPEEIRAWLTGLRERDRRAAQRVGEAVTALLDEGTDLGPPLVTDVEPALRAQDPRMALDHSYQRQLIALQRVRRGVADIATARKRLELQIEQAETRTRRAGVQAQMVELRRLYADQEREEEKAFLDSQRLQARVEEFRTRKEAIKAAYSAAQAKATIEEAAADIDEDSDEMPSADAELAAARSAAEALQETTDELEREAQKSPDVSPHNEGPLLRELRLAALTGHDVRILFVFEHPETVVLLAARDGRNQWRDWYDQALPDARGLLSERSMDAEFRSIGRTSPLPKPDFTSHTRQSFIDTFFPGKASELAAEAARLVARNRVQPLTEARRRAGLTQAQVASRMNLREERVAAIERADPGTTEIRTLAAYVQALGGRLEIIADLGPDRLLLG